MAPNLAPLYARYGLLASLTLDALEDLEAREKVANGAELIPRGDDRVRFERLRQMLSDSWQGAVASGAIIHNLDDPPSKATGRRRSTGGKLDDGMVVRRTLPQGCDFEDFIRKANTVLVQVVNDGIDRVTDREFLDGQLTEFLKRLADSNDYVTPVSRRGRDRTPLA